MNFSDAILDYAADVGVREHAAQKTCREETARMGGISRMQIAPEQGAFMAMTAKLMNAKRYIEVGTFTGYSALSMALALGDDGHVDALDISDEYVGKARGYWAAAGVTQKITAHIGPAVATLDHFLKDGRANRYDFAFIDADKSGYDAYYEAMLKLVRPGGLIAIDNALWGGRVCDPAQKDADTAAIRALDLFVRDDPRVEQVLLTVGDGVLLARKR